MIISSTYITFVRQDLGVLISLEYTEPVEIFTYECVFSHLAADFPYFQNLA